MEKTFFERSWALRKEAEQTINQYIAEQEDPIIMDGDLWVVYTSHWSDELCAGRLHEVTQGRVYVSNNKDDASDEWEPVDFSDVILHSFLELADAVIKDENRGVLTSENED